MPNKYLNLIALDIMRNRIAGRTFRFPSPRSIDTGTGRSVELLAVTGGKKRIAHYHLRAGIEPDGAGLRAEGWRCTRTRPRGTQRASVRAAWFYASASGGFHSDVPVGSYTVTGTSPDLNDGKLICYSDPRAVAVKPATVTTRDVFCSIR